MPRLDPNFLSNASEELKKVDEFTNRRVAGRGRAPVSDSERSELMQAVKKVLPNFGEVNRAGNLVHPVDRSIAREITQKSDIINAELNNLAAQGIKPTPFDYYDIYYKVLEDSGLLANSLPQPEHLRQLVDKTGGFKFGSDFELEAASSCGACTVCAFCGACTLCGICAVGPVVGTVGTGAIGAITGSVGFVL